MSPCPNLPSWRVKLDAARALGLASLTDEERRERACAQSAAIVAARQRKANARARVEKINGLVVEGMTPPEIARSIGVAVKTLRSLRRTWGLPLAQRVGFRRLFAWVSNDHVAALDRMAFDMGTDRGSALAELLAANLGEDGFVGRRTLQVRRRAA